MQALLAQRAYRQSGRHVAECRAVISMATRLQRPLFGATSVDRQSEATTTIDKLQIATTEIAEAQCNQLRRVPSPFKNLLTLTFGLTSGLRRAIMWALRLKK